MSSRSRNRRLAAVALVLCALVALAATHRRERPELHLRVLRVCADPNNLPFSNGRGEGFENRVAAIVAHDLGVPVEYTWWAQRRGFFRNTLRAHVCDVVVGVPVDFEMTLATRAYYRSTYVFVARRDRAFGIRSLDDPRLRTLRVGVQLVGDDGANTPPAHALARRGIVDNVVGYPVQGDYARDPPGGAVLDAVTAGEVDVAVVWGPLAGYFVSRRNAPFELHPVTPAREGPLPFTFDIAMGVRHGERALRDRLDVALARHQPEIDAVLAEYGVPRP